MKKNGLADNDIEIDLVYEELSLKTKFSKYFKETFDWILLQNENYYWKLQKSNTFTAAKLRGPLRGVNMCPYFEE